MRGLTFAIGVVLAGVLVALVKPGLRDPDSTLYAAMSTSISPQPLAKWLVPEWPEGRQKSGRFVEHTAVTLWPGAALERIGVTPGAQVANILCAGLLLWLVGALAERLAANTRAMAMAAWGGAIVCIQYWTRANHEVWWAAAALGVLWVIAAKRHWALAALFVALACAFKGVLGLDVVVLALPLAWVVGGRAWTVKWGVASLVFSVLLLVAYDAAYCSQTGVGFVESYLDTQLTYVGQIERHPWWLKPWNVVVYIGKAAFFSLPGALLLLANFRRVRVTPVGPLLLGALLVVLGTSLMSRHAARYIFPVFPVLAVAGAVVAKHAAITAWLQAKEKFVWLAVFILVVARIVFASAVYKPVNVLPGIPIQQRTE
ncbi:MAG: hypothetical protein ACO1OB_08145 [Archangium sp.]